MSNAANDRNDVPHGTALLPRDLTAEQLAAAPALASADALLIDDLTEVEDDAFAAATVAEVRFESRAIGHPLADRVHGNDLWIAASAIHLGISLITADRIFDGVRRLTVVSRRVGEGVSVTDLVPTDCPRTGQYGSIRDNIRRHGETRNT